MFPKFIQTRCSRLTLVNLLACGVLSLFTATSHAENADLTLKSPNASSSVIRLNQVGYRTRANKVAIVLSQSTSEFEVVGAEGSEVVFRGKLSEPVVWEYSKESVQQADFSKLDSDGLYRLRVGKKLSSPFSISDAALDSVHEASIKSFYLNRASIELKTEYAGIFARKLGHPDTDVKVHGSAAGPLRETGSSISAPRGWYDAGDYGKYTVNSGISTYTMLLAFEHFSDEYKTLDLSIPESSNAIPDLLDEIKWNLDWLESMQDTDGGVYHKLTALNFSNLNTMPDQDVNQRWVIGKSVTAALDFAAVMAMASRVMSPYDAELDNVSQRYRKKAIRAYAWAKKHPDAIYKQPEDVSTGAYSDDEVSDEFAWAAAELFLLTKDKAYWNDYRQQELNLSAHLNWGNVSVLPLVSLVSFGEGLLGQNDYALVKKQLQSSADELLALHEGSAYNVAMNDGDFQWGSNSSALNNGLVLYQAYLSTMEEKYQTAALSTLDYVLGTNATGYSFVTGYGNLTPMHIHHRPSVADTLSIPVPGFLAGGPHTGRQDKCPYDGDLPATNYADIECSYSTNEIAINWNAPLVYILGAAVSQRD